VNTCALPRHEQLCCSAWQADDMDSVNAGDAQAVLRDMSADLEAGWVACPRNRMRMYSYIDAAWDIVCFYPSRSDVADMLGLALRAIMAATPDLVACELPVALAVICDCDGWDRRQDVQALWAVAGVPGPWPAVWDVSGLTNMMEVWRNHEVMEPCGIAAVRDLVQPMLPLLRHSQLAWDCLCEMLLRGFQSPESVSVATDFARAMYALDARVFCDTFAGAVGAVSDGVEDIEQAEEFWGACGLPGTWRTP